MAFLVGFKGFPNGDDLSQDEGLAWGKHPCWHRDGTCFPRGFICRLLWVAVPEGERRMGWQEGQNVAAPKPPLCP